MTALTRRLLAISFAAIAAIVVAPLSARAAASVPSDTTVMLVNIYPGDEIYELEGHTVLRITAPGYDIGVNWGVFDFNAPGFVYRFVKGETDYMAAAYPWEAILWQYRNEQRRMTGHRLSLTPEQTQRLIALVSENLLPGNATYRYNYVKDNCATRPLRLVEKAIGDTIILADKPRGEARSFRDQMRRCHANYPWYQFGIDLALGPCIDYTITSREMCFAPIKLDTLLLQAIVGGKPLVSESMVLIDEPATARIKAPTPLPLTPMAVALIVLALAVGVSWRDVRRGRVSRWLDTTFYTLLGLTGCLIAFLVFISSHYATTPNYLIVWLNPLCLIPPIFIWIKKCQRVVMWYQIINFAVILILSCAWAWLPQSANAAFWPLIAADAVLAARYIYIYTPRHVKAHKP